MAIHDISDNIFLNNGESLIYTIRKKNQIIEQFRFKQKNIISGFEREGIPATDEEYRRYYSSFENLPFAFTDIEMVFNDESRAVDWFFRYGNPALAKLEKLSLQRLIGSSAEQDGSSVLTGETASVCVVLSSLLLIASVLVIYVCMKIDRSNSGRRS